MSTGTGEPLLKAEVVAPTETADVTEVVVVLGSMMLSYTKRGRSRFLRYLGRSRPGCGRPRRTRSCGRSGFVPLRVFFQLMKQRGGMIGRITRHGCVQTRNAPAGSAED